MCFGPLAGTSLVAPFLWVSVSSPEAQGEDGCLVHISGATQTHGPRPHLLSTAFEVNQANPPCKRGNGGPVKPQPGTLYHPPQQTDPDRSAKSRQWQEGEAGLRHTD